MALFSKKTDAAPGVMATPDDAFVAPISEDAVEAPVKPPRNWSPTLDELLAMPDDGTFEKVRVPLVTKAARLQYPKFIKFNSRKFLPGKTYNLHPIVAKELRDAIERFENIPTEQMTGKTNLTPELLEELRFQAAERVSA